MKTIETKLFSYKELSSEAQKQVIEKERKRIQQDPEDFTLSECVESLKAIAESLNVKLTDWNIGPYNRNNHASVNSDEQGNKALARFARVLQHKGYTIPSRFKDMKFPGICAFTGVCFDEDVCETIWKALLDGETLSKAFDRAADKIMHICESDLEYRQTDAAILEYLDQSVEIYTEEGNEF